MNRQMHRHVDTLRFGVTSPFTVGSILQLEVWGDLCMGRANPGTAHTGAVQRNDFQAPPMGEAQVIGQWQGHPDPPAILSSPQEMWMLREVSKDRWNPDNGGLCLAGSHV